MFAIGFGIEASHTVPGLFYAWNEGDEVELTVDREYTHLTLRCAVSGNLQQTRIARNGQSYLLPRKGVDATVYALQCVRLDNEASK